MPNGIGIDAMVSEKEVAPLNSRHWVDWLSVHLWWAALLAGGILCVVALVMT